MHFFSKRIYMDYASSTPVMRVAVRAQASAAAVFGNPGSIHLEGVQAKKVLAEARAHIAAELACKAREVVFVSGGTEANNLAIVGFARKLERVQRTLKGTHWVVSAIEHPSVLECFSEVERLGGEVTHLQPGLDGRITPAILKSSLKKETVFVSIGWANHEIGVVQPLSDLAQEIHSHERAYSTTVIFHSDAAQAPLYRAPHVHTLDVDILTLDSGKLYGPRGIGAMYLSNRTELSPVILGGGQERGLRAGTENVALAAGFAAAMQGLTVERTSENRRLKTLRDSLAQKITTLITNIVINGNLAHALPHMLNISIPETDCEYLTLALDKQGIAVATKSACREGEESRSHVITALIQGSQSSQAWRAERTVRLSLGRDTTVSSITYTAKEIARAVKLYRLKRMV